MIKKITHPLILLVYISSTYSANIENIEHKKTTIVDILYSDIVAIILSSAKNLKELNELLGKFIYILPKNSNFINGKNSDIEAIQIINKYLENRFKGKYDEKYNKPVYYQQCYSLLKNLALESKYKNILKLLSCMKISSIWTHFPTETVLHHCIEYYDYSEKPVEYAALLINLGVDVNIRNRVGEPALIWAICRGRNEIVKLLIDAGADINAENNFGTTARSIALESNDREIRNLIKNAPGYKKSCTIL